MRDHGFRIVRCGSVKKNLWVQPREGQLIAPTHTLSDRHRHIASYGEKDGPHRTAAVQSSCFFVLLHPATHRQRRTTADADTEDAHRRVLLALEEFMGLQERGADKEPGTRRAADSKGVHRMGLYAQDGRKGARKGGCGAARCGRPGPPHHRRDGHAPRAQDASIASGWGVEGCLPPCPGTLRPHPAEPGRFPKASLYMCTTDTCKHVAIFINRLFPDLYNY